jgi:hypothetical protein
MTLRSLRLLARWTVAHMRRMVRDDVVLRALVAPPVLLAGTLAVTALVVSSASAPGPVAVADQALTGQLEARGVPVMRVEEAEAALRSHGTDRAIWGEAGQWHFATTPTGWARWSGQRARADLAVEAALRGAIGADWVVELPDAADARATLPGQVDLLARGLAVLYSLYAVVLAVAATVRDRETGVLEAAGTVPLPGWMRPVARWLAVGGVVGVLLVSAQLLVGALLGHAQPVAWGLHGLASVLVGAALGIGAPAGRRWRPVGPLSGAPGGLSTPLSGALVVLTGLGGVGLAAPVVAGWLPAASLTLPTVIGKTAAVPLVLALVVGVGAGVRAGRAGW